jgi:hypothetical protein
LWLIYIPEDQPLPGSIIQVKRPALMALKTSMGISHYQALLQVKRPALMALITSLRISHYLALSFR